MMYMFHCPECGGGGHIVVTDYAVFTDFLVICVWCDKCVLIVV